MTEHDRNATINLWVLVLGGACLVAIAVLMLAFGLHGLANLSDRLWGPN